MMAEGTRPNHPQAVSLMRTLARGRRQCWGRWAGAALLGFVATIPAAAQESPRKADALRTRLAESSVLPPEEVAALINQTRQVIEGRRLRVTDGTTSSVVDERGRDVLFVILSGTVPIEDVGVQPTPAGRVRGLRAPATPPRSEVGAKQTLWIDIATLLPRRFEFAYEVPGLGDIAYDLVFD
jgi:hypothetical protein